MEKEKISTRLTRLRKKRNLSIVETSKRLGVPVSTYRDWEYGSEIKGEPYSKIAEVLNVSLIYLLTGVEERKVKAISEIVERIELELILLKSAVSQV